jgi:hypothetical protein
MNCTDYFFVRFVTFTAVTMKNVVFWDVALCRSCINGRFGGKRIAYIFMVEKSVSKEPVRAGGCSSRIFLPWRWRRYVPPKRRLTQDLHSATSQNMTFFRLLLGRYHLFQKPFSSYILSKRPQRLKYRFSDLYMGLKLVPSYYGVSSQTSCYSKHLE